MRGMDSSILSIILLLFFVFIVGVSICLILINTQHENVGLDPKPDKLVSDELITIDVKLQSENEVKKICALHKN